MVSALDSRSSSLGSSPGWGTVLCSWERHVILIVPLFTQVYKWIPANLLLGVTLQWTSIPSRASRKYYQAFHAKGTGLSSGTDGPLGLYADTYQVTAVHSLVVIQLIWLKFLLSHVFRTFIPDKMTTSKSTPECAIQDRPHQMDLYKGMVSLLCYFFLYLYYKP